MTATIKALAPWFGGKRTLGSEIVAEFGKHSAYWGICCGSLAVEFAKEPCPMETCIDLHGDLTNLAFVLQDFAMAESLYGQLARTLLSREIFLRSAEIINNQQPHDSEDAPSVARAYHYMIVSWFGRNGVSGTSSYNSGFCARYTKNGGHAAKRFVSAVESIPAWHERLRNVTIMREDIFNVLPRIEDESGVVIYCDPPYLRKGAKYAHDFTAEQHIQLAAELNRFQKSRVIVSYYDEPELATLYDGWTVRRLQATKALVNQGMRDKGGATVAPEVLLINGESFVESRGLF